MELIPGRVLARQDGYHLVELDQVIAVKDEYNDRLKADSFAVFDEDGECVGSFEYLGEAKSFFKDLTA